MRTSATWMMLGLCGLFATTACATMKEVQKVATQEVKKEVAAVKKGEVGAIGAVGLGVAVNKKLADDAALKGANIDADVKDTTVHLKGTATAEQKAHAEKVMKELPGVTKVTNDIKVAGAAGASKASAKDDDDNKDKRAAPASAKKPAGK